MNDKCAYRRWMAAAALTASSAILAGCIQVEAPDKPIVIELNMNIRQEVVYRIDEKAEALIDQREDIF